MSSRYDDELWSLVPEQGGPPPRHLAGFVRSLTPAAHTLDLGCGDGRLSELLDTERLTISDVSEVALDRARRRLPAATPVLLDPDAPLPLPENAFDLVLCAETLEHVRDVQLLLSEARRVLRPRGRLAVTTPAHGRLTALRLAVLGFESGFEPLSPHLRFFTQSSLSALLGSLGFDAGRVQRRAGTLLAVATR